MYCYHGTNEVVHVEVYADVEMQHKYRQIKFQFQVRFCEIKYPHCRSQALVLIRISITRSYAWQTKNRVWRIVFDTCAWLSICQCSNNGPLFIFLYINSDFAIIHTNLKQSRYMCHLVCVREMMSLYACVCCTVTLNRPPIGLQRYVDGTILDDPLLDFLPLCSEVQIDVQIALLVFWCHHNLWHTTTAH